tara:strand:- start:525 stop:644 length:120 start_codon:yes stop_codon:yes gene_type:complete
MKLVDMGNCLVSVSLAGGKRGGSNPPPGANRIPKGTRVI